MNRIITDQRIRGCFTVGICARCSPLLSAPVIMSWVMVRARAKAMARAMIRVGVRVRFRVRS